MNRKHLVILFVNYIVIAVLILKALWQNVDMTFAKFILDNIVCLSIVNFVIYCFDNFILKTIMLTLENEEDEEDEEEDNFQTEEEKSEETSEDFEEFDMTSSS